MMPYEEQMILTNAVEKYGEEMQIIVAVEKLSELTKALTKYLRGNNDVLDYEHIAEEMADVYIMLEQLRIIFNNPVDLEEWKDIKLKRLAERIEKEY